MIKIHAVALALALANAPAAAQFADPTAGSGPRSGFPEPEAELSRQLTILAGNPSSIPALTAAGRSALELGDPQAALTFFGRAEELAPNDGPIKAGLGSALVMMEQGRTALKVFDEAIRLGVPEADIAAYRGLAFDLVGDPGRAQRDYQLALRRKDDPEVRRRLALSQAIGGNRDAALLTIDDQLRRQDRAAWRTRAFILALTGDAAGATRAVQAVMPAQAAAWAPFLAKLPSLAPADRALAVNFGHFPGDTQPLQTAAAVPPPDPLPREPATAAGKPDSAQRPLGTTVAASPVRPAPAPAPAAPTRIASGQIAQPAQAQPASVQPIQAAPQPAAPALDPRLARRLADIAALVEALPAASEQTSPALPARPPAKSKAEASPRAAIKPDAKAASAKKDEAAKKAEAAKAKEPSRIWVQLAHAASENALPGQYRIIKAKAPKLLSTTTVWTSAARTTNRLLVGPFKSDKEAQSFIDKLDKEDVIARSWTSPAGQEIKKLASK